MAIDRAGVVGRTVKTHQGVFDAAYLQTIPNATVYSPPTLGAPAPSSPTWWRRARAVRHPLPRGKELHKPAYFQSTTAPTSVYGEKDAPAVHRHLRPHFLLCRGVPGQAEREGIRLKLIKLNRIIPIDPAAWRRPAPAAMCSSLRRASSGGGIGEHFPSC